jgi:hypothetical protein
VAAYAAVAPELSNITPKTLRKEIYVVSKPILQTMNCHVQQVVNALFVPWAVF